MNTFKSFLVFALVAATLNAAVAKPGNLHFPGDINVSSIKRLIKRIDKALLKNSGTKKELIISLSSLGGEMNQAILATKYIRKLNSNPQIEIHTSVSGHSSCESACTLLYTAGEKRFASYGSRFGFHSPKFKSGKLNGMTRAEVEELYRKIRLDYISWVDKITAEMLQDNRYLFDDEMRYIIGRDLTSGYVTDLI